MSALHAQHVQHDSLPATTPSDATLERWREIACVLEMVRTKSYKKTLMVPLDHKKTK